MQSCGDISLGCRVLRGRGADLLHQHVPDVEGEASSSSLNLYNFFKICVLIPAPACSAPTGRPANTSVLATAAMVIVPVQKKIKRQSQF